MPFRRFDILALVAYAFWLAMIVSLTFYGRRSMLESLSTPQAQADWQQWREDVKTLNEKSPVTRRVPKSDEPPALVLMRDYFGVVFMAAVLFSSLLFAAIAFPLRGVLSERGQSPVSPDVPR